MIVTQPSTRPPPLSFYVVLVLKATSELRSSVKRGFRAPSGRSFYLFVVVRLCFWLAGAEVCR